MKKNNLISNLLYGSYTLNVDQSGRFVLPSEYRNVLGDSCYILKGVGCLWLMPADYFNNIMAELNGKTKNSLFSMFNNKMATVKRHMFSGMSQCSPEADKNFRITLTGEQKKYAAITNSIKMFGVGDYVEIWSPANWELNRADSDNEILDFAGEVFAPEPTEKEDDIS